MNAPRAGPPRLAQETVPRGVTVRETAASRRCGVVPGIRLRTRGSSGGTGDCASYYGRHKATRYAFFLVKCANMPSGGPSSEPSSETLRIVLSDWHVRVTVLPS